MINLMLTAILSISTISSITAAKVSQNAASRYPGCPIDYISRIGDSHCDHQYNIRECDYDRGDCLEFEARYPNCKAKYKHWIGDTKCNSGEYNTPECGYDGGDCIEFNLYYPNCKVQYPYIVGDNSCFGKEYNTPECGYDGGDCVEFNKNYPGCNVERPYLVGDGKCQDSPEYNSFECGEFLSCAYCYYKIRLLTLP